MDNITDSVVGTEDVRTTMAVDGEAMENVFVGTAQDNRIWTEDGLFANSYYSGDGSINSPFKIATAAQLARLSQQVCDKGKDKDKYFELIADIDLSAHLWKPIGHDDQIFKGHFNGNRYTIYGMRIIMKSRMGTWLNLGLFGHTDHAEIHDVNVVGLSICGEVGDNLGITIQAGGIAGQAVHSRIYNCSVQGSDILVTIDCEICFNLISGIIFAGGIVGKFNSNIESWGSDIQYCASYVKNIFVDFVNNDKQTLDDLHVGGLVGNAGWSGDYGVRQSFTISNVGKSVLANDLALGAAVGLCNLSSNRSGDIFSLNESTLCPLGKYFSKAYPIEFTVLARDEMKNKIKAVLVDSSNRWVMSEYVNDGFAFPGKLYNVRFKYLDKYVDYKAAYGYTLTTPPESTFDGGILLGWYDRNGVQYRTGDIYLLSKDIELTAKVKLIDKYIVTFDKQGGCNGSDRIIATKDKDMLPINVPTRIGNNFNGYFSQEKGDGTQYYDADGRNVHICDLTADCVLYAYWEPVCSNVKLMKEGGGGGPVSVTGCYGYYLPPIQPPIRLAYKFGGYYLYPNGGGSQFYDAWGGGTKNYTFCSDTALYAMWHEDIGIEIKISVPCTQTVYRDDDNYPLHAIAEVHCLIPGVEINGKWTKKVSSNQEDTTTLTLQDTIDEYTQKYTIQVFSVEQNGIYTFSIMPVLDGSVFKTVYSEPIQLTMSLASISFEASNIIQYYDGTPKQAVVVQTPGEKPEIYLYSVTYQNVRTGERIDAPIEVGDYEIWVSLKNPNLKFMWCEENMREKSIAIFQILQGSFGIENPRWNAVEDNKERAIALWDKLDGADRYIVQLLKDGSPIVLTDDMLPDRTSLLYGGIKTTANSVDLSKAVTTAGNFTFTVAGYDEGTKATGQPSESPVLMSLDNVKEAKWKDSMTLSWSAVEGADYYVVQLFNDGEPAMLDTSAETNILKIIDAEQGLFKVIGTPEVNNQTLFMNVFGICTYNVLPGSDQHDHYVPINYEPTVSDIRP